MTEDRQGVYAKWTWDEIRKCWEYLLPCRIYPLGDGFSVSTDEVWHDKSFNNFDDAESEALMPSQD